MIYYTNELSHHGVKGMKWGIRKQHERYAQYKSIKFNEGGIRKQKSKHTITYYTNKTNRKLTISEVDNYKINRGFSIAQDLIMGAIGYKSIRGIIGR